MFTTFLYMLPENEVSISSSVSLSTYMPDGGDIQIDGDRIKGYFLGDIDGLPDGIPIDSTRTGDLNID